VFKHTVLIFCLDHLAQKPKPFLYIDTHAGAGAYPLDSGFAAQNREWEQGIGMMAGAAAGTTPLPAMAARYIEVVHGERAIPAALPYPGSPLIAAALLRPQDQACCFEPHPADFETLGRALKQPPQGFAGGRRFRVKKEDGLAGLKSLLPPASRRALVFIDPSYELNEDYPHLVTALEDSLRRFPTGLYIIWYPLLSGTVKGQGIAETLMNLYNGPRCQVELQFTPPVEENAHLHGCGLAIYNPPWTLKAGLEETMPCLAERLELRSWNLDWKEP
jgi:23S rRNA (adenine2030-N6)-methyltransferase